MITPELKNIYPILWVIRKTHKVRWTCVRALTDLGVLAELYPDLLAPAVQRPAGDSKLCGRLLDWHAAPDGLQRGVEVILGQERSVSGRLSNSYCLTWLQVVATALNGWASSIPSFLAILYSVELGILYTLEALLAEISFFLRASSALKIKHVNIVSLVSRHHSQLQVLISP